MRLVERHEDGTLSLTNDLPDHEIPEYVVLSHTWGPTAQEVTMQDFNNASSEGRTGKAGYKKILFCSDQAARDGYRYSWVDTCCIDKTNHVELTEAINSMFRWYHEAARCYVYLSDVQVVDQQSDAWLNAFSQSRWHTRGWTLQEMLAPKIVHFFSSDGTQLGDRTSLADSIHAITGVAIDALHGRSLSDFSVSERMDWAAKRETTRKEDEAYSLLGIFGIHMPLIYGEREGALLRLREYIARSTQNSDPASSQGPILHPVKRNYRKVHVTLLHWEIDGLQTTVQKIIDTFQSLYRYQVREVSLPHRHRAELSWPYLDESLVDESDLQIMYYLGSTTSHSSPADHLMNLAACPAKSMHDYEPYPNDPEAPPGAQTSEKWPTRNWLGFMLGIPNLVSDVFIVLDCFVEGMVDTPIAPEDITFVIDDDYQWARYMIVLAGYRNPSTIPGKFSDGLMALLRDLATSGKFYAREGLITTGNVREKLEREMRFEDDFTPLWFGNDNRDGIHVTPLARSAMP